MLDAWGVLVWLLVGLTWIGLLALIAAIAVWRASRALSQVEPEGPSLEEWHDDAA